MQSEKRIKLYAHTIVSFLSIWYSEYQHICDLNTNQPHKEKCTTYATARPTLPISGYMQCGSRRTSQSGWVRDSLFSRITLLCVVVYFAFFIQTGTHDSLVFLFCMDVWPERSLTVPNNSLVRINSIKKSCLDSIAKSFSHFDCYVLLCISASCNVQHSTTPTERVKRLPHRLYYSTDSRFACILNTRCRDRNLAELEKIHFNYFYTHCNGSHCFDTP